jgi:hypothetical protein
MQKIMFNERYGLQSAVFEGRKTQTRREPFYSDDEVGCTINKKCRLECYNDYNGIPKHTSRYAIGEIVAIAQRYDEVQNGQISSFEKGWKNKMFVKAELMPHHIKITNIRCEMLQDISARDCISEGIKCYYEPKNDWFNRPNKKQSSFSFLDKSKENFFCSAKEAFCGLIGKLNGKKFWDTNPYVIVYDFELVD